MYVVRHHPHLRFFLEKKSRDFPIFFSVNHYTSENVFLYKSKSHHNSKNRKIAKPQNRNEKNAGVDDA